MAEQDPYTLQTLLDIALVTELCFGAAANFLILRVFYRKPALLTIANRFIVNLTVINVIACLTLLPLSIADNTSRLTLPYLPSLCSLDEFFSHFAASVLPYSVLLIAVDQYFAVVDPLHYHSIITGVRSVCMIAAAWLLPLALSVASLIQAHTHQSVFRACLLLKPELNSTEIIESLPKLEAHQSMTWLSLIFSLTFILASFIIPFILICFIYSRICAAVSLNEKRTKHGMGHVPEKSNLSCTDSNRTDETDWEDDAGLQMEAPVVTLTRPSPPRESLPRVSKSANDLLLPLAVAVHNQSLPDLKRNRAETETNLLRPFLPKRRHSNVPIPRVEPDFHAKQRSLSKHSSFSSSSRSSPVSRASSLRSTSSFIVSNLRHRLSNAGLFRYREQARAARVSALVVVMALICWFPLFLLYALQAGISLVTGAEPHVPALANTASIALLLVSTVASPALFAFRNRKIRKEIKRTFKLPVNEFKTCPNGLTKKRFVLRFKQQAVELISNISLRNNEKSVVSVLPAKPAQ